MLYVMYIFKRVYMVSGLNHPTCLVKFVMTVNRINLKLTLRTRTVHCTIILHAILHRRWVRPAIRNKKIYHFFIFVIRLILCLLIIHQKLVEMSKKILDQLLLTVFAGQLNKFL